VIFGSAKIDGTSNSASRADHTHGNPTHVAADHAAIPISALAAATGAINMGGFQINNLPNSPSSANDAASKMYVDIAITGLTWKNPVDVASTAQVALTGTPTIDGVATALFNRVLLKNQTAPAENGIWQVNSGAWTRVTDADIGTELIDAAVYVKLGTTQADTAWVCTTDSPLNIGTTAITWVQFAGSGMVVAGSGLSQSGNTLNVGATNASIVVAADDISVGYGGTGGNFGAAATAARSDHVHTGVYPPVARLINTTAPLTGGGDLSADRTLAINNFGSAAAGAVPASGGGTANYLRADGTWAVPPVDTATGDTRYSRKFSAVNIGGALSQLVTHNLSNFAVLVNVYRTIAPGDTVECDVERTNANQITLRFAVAPATNEYSCVVVG
jgi:hypothetical protein